MVCVSKMIYYGLSANPTTLPACSKAGVCSGHGGIFVQGEFKVDGKKVQCEADGATLLNAVSTIRAAGCQTCGWIETDQSEC